MYVLSLSETRLQVASVLGLFQSTMFGTVVWLVVDASYFVLAKN